MAVTAVTITSGPTVVGRSVTISGTLDRDGGGTNNNINFTVFTVGNVNQYPITRLSDGATVYNASGTAGSNIAWSWTGTLPEGDYLGVTVKLSEAPNTLLATSSNVGLIQLRKPLAGIWTPRRDARGLFVPSNPAYPSIAGGGTGRPLRGFFYPTPDGVYRSVTNSTTKYGQYGGIARGVPTQWGLGIDAPNNWEWRGSSPQGYAPGTGSHFLVSVFSLHNASTYVNLYPGVLGESRTSASVDSIPYVFWRNPNGEQSLLVNISTGYGGTAFSINGLSNGLHCLVIAVTLGSGASGLRAYLNGSLVAVSSAPTYVDLFSLRPYYYWGSISQSHLNVGNVLLNAEVANVNLSESAAANLSVDPYRYFFRDAPKTSPKQRLFSGVLSLPDPPTEFTSVKGGKLLPQPWRQQPTYRAELNTANPLTRGIIHAGTPYHDVSDAVGSLSWKDSARPPIGTGRSGLFWASSPYSHYNIGSPNNYENRDQTVLWIVSYEYDSYTGTFPNIKGPSGGDNSGSGIGVRSDGNIVYFGNSHATLIDTGVKIPLRATNIIVLTSNTANGTNIYLNGNKIGSSATRYSFDDGYYSSLNRLGYVGADGNYITVQGRQAYPVYTYGVAQWITALSETQAKQLSENPWQIFRPNPGHRYFLPAKDTSFKGGRFLPQRWKKQPQGIVQVDVGNPIVQALGVDTVWSGTNPTMRFSMRNGGLRTNSLNAFDTKSVRQGINARVSGVGVNMTAANNPDIDLGAMPNMTEFTYIAVLSQGSTVNAFAFSTRVSGGTFTPGFDLLIGNGGVAGYANIRVNSDVGYSDTGVLGLNDSFTHTYFGTWKAGTAAQIYVDRPSNTSSTGAVANGVIIHTQNLKIGNRNSTRFTGFVGLVFVGTKQDTNAGLQLLENPWQIFKPNPGRSYFLPAPAKRGKFLFFFN